MKWSVEKGVEYIIGKKKSWHNDRDKDGVPNAKDCQPDNPLRQDMIQDLGMLSLKRMSAKLEGPKQQEVVQTRQDAIRGRIY